MSIAISKIYKEAHKEGMPISAPGIILFSLETSIVNKANKNKAYRYKVPYFTDAKLLTHDQLERINKIISEEHDLSVDYKPKKDVSLMDVSKYHLSETEYPSLENCNSKQSQKQSKKQSKKQSQQQEEEHKIEKEIEVKEKSKEEQREDIINQLEKEWNEDAKENSKEQIQNKTDNESKKMSKRDKLNKYKRHH